MTRTLSPPRALSRRLLVEALEPRVLLAADPFRSFDGTDNNRKNADWGSAGTQLLRLTTVEYADGVSEPAGGLDGAGRPNPREISNLVVAQSGDILNDRQLTSFVFQWGQFLDHDMGLTEDARPAEGFSIPVPADDPVLNPAFPIPLLRSRFDTSTGTDVGNPRQQINQISAYIDGSNVYGSDDTKAQGLRAGYGGLLLTSDGTQNLGAAGDLLPYNYQFEGEFLENATPPPHAPQDLFIAGDIRANEQPGLTSLHTLFVREHNYQARRLAEQWMPGVDESDIRGAADTQIYQLARQIVAAEIQSITYNEFLPALLGPDQLASYSGYDKDVNAGIANIFSGALYRVGHTMLPDELLRLAEDGTPLPDGPVALGDAFFDPTLITQYGIEPYLKGLAVQNIQEIDVNVVDGVRNLLFDPPAQFDLAATNLQRGRDHGLPDYNQAMQDFGLPPIGSFYDVTSNPELAELLSQAYDGDLNNIDVWLGGVAGDHIPGGSVGRLIQTVLVDQFTRLRDGDRFYFENAFHGRALNELLNTRFSDIVVRNTSLSDLQSDVFRDESVLVVRAPEGQGPAILSARVQDGEVQVADRRGRVLAARPLDQTSRVVVFGTSKNDRITVDSSVAEWLRVPMELHGGGGAADALIIQGTSADDRVVIDPTEVRVNDLSMAVGGFERLSVDSAAGNDQMQARGAGSMRLVMAGGTGDDIMLASASPAVMLGGAGNDQLVGGVGRDLLVGGPGEDLLQGGGDQDVMLGGEATYQPQSMAWDLAMMVWKMPANLPMRVALTNMLLFRTQGSMATVLDDQAVDTLLGGADSDWFLLGSANDLLPDFEPDDRIS